MESLNELVTRLKAVSRAEQVECLDELITNILSRLSTRDVLRMSTVEKRWHTLIFEPGFAHTHFKNCPKETLFCLILTPEVQHPFRSCNSQTGDLSIVPFSLEGLASYFQEGKAAIVATSYGLICFHEDEFDVSVLWVYNPVTKFLKELPKPFEEDIMNSYNAEICYSQDHLKLVMVFGEPEKHPYTQVFDSHLNSWKKGPHLLINTSTYENKYQSHSDAGDHVFFNGVIYVVVEVKIKDAQELEGFRDLERSYEDGVDSLGMIMGYDVNQDQWVFSVFVPASVGYIFHLIEWERSLLVCASDDGEGYFVFWILDTEHKLWIRERELDLTHERRFFEWEVHASSGEVWFSCGRNSVTVYHMKNRQLSRYRVHEAYDLKRRTLIPFVTFEPSLLSF